jgi:hypothetical protein
LISRQEKRSGCKKSSLLSTAWLVLAAASPLLAQPATAAEYSISGESNTFLRMKSTIDDRNTYPLYEYLRLSVAVAEKDGSATSLHLGAWGRVDLGDKWTQDRVDGDLQYGYLSYRGAKNNLLLNAGRQFVTEGVATERIDGLSVRSDLAAGFAASAFVGSPVVSEPNFEGGDVIYGGRVSQGKQGLYSVGLSALRSEGDDDREREEQGIDIWVHPLKQVDITGRSSYNSLTSGWMEHAYTVSVAPMDQLNLSADFSRVNYNDFFYHVTTSALSLTNGILLPNEEQTALGLRASYSPVKNLTLAADYKNFHYSVAGDADYFGGGASYALPGSLTTGFGVHRMDGASDRLQYTECRLYALKQLGKLDLAADFFNVNYDQRVNDVKNSFALTGSAGYRFTEKLKVWGDLEYSQSPDFDHEMRGLVRVAYAFDTIYSDGRGKSEK